jgi:hypothetical protein
VAFRGNATGCFFLLLLIVILAACLMIFKNTNFSKSRARCCHEDCYLNGSDLCQGR